MQKEHFEILLEDISKKFDLVLEGHAALDRKIDDRFNDLNEKIEQNTLKVLNKKIDDVEARLGAKIDSVASGLAAHRADTEAHRQVYGVRERNE